ncbi:MAG: hypothetical protein KH921_06955 [Erysipelotrichaceae bacterium]|nr:hypothetical protein [Erysipelotrichaceae bacterium]
MEMIFVFCVGVLTGCIISKIISRTKVIGSLRVDTSDPEDGPYLFLELSKSMDVVAKKKYVILKVNLNSFIPHK